MDSLSLFNDSLCNIFSFFYNDVDNRNSCLVNGNRKDGTQSLLDWSWNLIDKNKILQIYETSAFSIGTGPFGIGKKPEWEILRLTNKELYSA